MNVIPFNKQPGPEAEPEPAVESFYEILARKAIEIAGDKTIREAIDEMLKTPLKDAIEAFQGLR